MPKHNLIVYKNKWIIERIYEVSDELRSRVTDQTLFEERCINRVGGYLDINSSNVRNRRYIERMIREVASSILGRNKNEAAELFTDLGTKDEESDEEIEYEPIDVLANVESEVIKKETITLLAQDDRRRTSVLEAWALGNTNDSQISRTLARTFGGNFDSQRKFVQRFQKECREQLLSAAI